LTAPLHRFVLPGGARLIVAPDPEAAAVSVSFAIAAGAADEPARLPGVAHLTEHLLVRAANRTPALGPTGAAFRGETTLDACTLEAWCRAEDLATVVQAGAAGLTGAIDPEAVAVERAVVAAELSSASRRDLGGREAARRRGAFGRGHPYSRNVAGDADVVRALEAQDLEAFRSAAHTTSGLAVVVHGAVDAATVHGIATAVDLRLPGAASPRSLPPAAATRERGAQATLPAPAAGAPDAVGARAWAELLTRRLNRGGAGGWARAWAGRDAGLILISCAAEGAALESARALAAEPVDPEALQAVKDADIAREDETRRRGSRLAHAEVVGRGAESLAADRARFDALEPRDVEAFAARIDWGGASTRDVPFAPPSPTRTTVARSWNNDRWDLGTDLLAALTSDPLGPILAAARDRDGLIYSCLGYPVRSNRFVVLARTESRLAAATAASLDAVLARLGAGPTDAEIDRAVAYNDLGRRIAQTVERYLEIVGADAGIDPRAALVEAARRILGRAPDRAYVTEGPP